MTAKPPPVSGTLKSRRSEGAGEAKGASARPSTKGQAAAGDKQAKS